MTTHQKPKAGPGLSADTFADILSALNKAGAGLTKEGKPRKVRSPTDRRANPPVRSRAQEHNLRRTGYLSWTPIAIQHSMQREVCSCCGSAELRFQGSHYLLENGLAKATWLRLEGLQLPAEPLEVRIHIIDGEKSIPVCARCVMEPSIEALFEAASVQLSLGV